MNWKEELKKNITSIEELKEYIDLNEREETLLWEVISKHPMSISRYYISLIDKDDPKDPVRRMIVPSIDELDHSGTYDPSDELSNTKMPGLQHKYEQTALILATNMCTTYCRHCFRKRLVGLGSDEILRRLEDSVDYISDHPEINNVLISGGDPFTLKTNMIDNILDKLSTIPHLDFIRFGTRVPVVFPHRILEDEELLQVLKKYSSPKRRLFVVTHFNHPREITDLSIDVVDKLIKSEIIINNQTVLLNDVNDNASTMVKLLNRLISIGVNPYYVFQCRPVKRVKKHFPVPLKRGCKIIREANKQLDGHSKRFRYAMSHKAGKIEILGLLGDNIYFKFHEAKNPENVGKLFARRLPDDMSWLDESLGERFKIPPTGYNEDESTA